MTKPVRIVKMLPMLVGVAVFMSCEDTVSNSGKSSTSSSTKVSRTNVVGKWVMVASDYDYNETGVERDVFRRPEQDTSELIVITEESSTFYLKNSNSFHKVVRDFTYNQGNYSATKSGDTLMIRYTESEENNGWEYESKYFLPFKGEVLPADWPTTEEPFDDYLFL